MDSIYKYKDFGQNIYHFNSLESVEQSQFGDILDPIIVIAEDKSGDHTQIKVLPFNLFNTDKNESNHGLANYLIANPLFLFFS